MKTLKALRDQVIELLEVSREHTRYRNLPMADVILPKTPKLLGSSLKVMLSQSRGFLTGISYLSPAWESGVNTCPFHTKACARTCLGHSSGQLAFDHAKNARLWKTLFYYADRELFDQLMDREIRSLVTRAGRNRLFPSVRFDGSTDLGHGERLALRHPDVTFYDYTKTPKRAFRYVEGETPRNYHLCFSSTGEEDNTRDAWRVLEGGGFVAVVYDVKKGEPLPPSWYGFPVVNGDAHDAYFTWPKGSVIGLRLKGTKTSVMDIARASAFVWDPVDPLSLDKGFLRRWASVA